MLPANLNAALIITVIGMGLVFAAIILLWGVMAAIVHLLPDAAAPEPAADAPESAAPDYAEALRRDQRLRERAAVAAVTAALASQHPTGHPQQFGVPASAIVSAWQAVQRSRMLNRRGLR
jgi:sodium pump decarboxylase gamma subunit